MIPATDICVVGGGPAGCVLAARLALFGLSVCLVERARFPRRRLGESLSPGVLPLLESIGAGPAIEQARYPRVRAVSVHWDEQREREDPGEQGMLVDRGSFDRLLLEHARQCGVRILQPAVVTGLNPCASGWDLAVTGERSTTALEARFVADATGRGGILRRRRRRTGPSTLALHAYWTGSGLPTHPRIEAGSAQWYWGVPLPDGVYNTLVFIDPRDLRALPGTLEEKFHQLLAASSLLPSGADARLVGSVRATDATPYLDQECVTEDSIKVGEAALAVDPLSSSGVQKAVQSALAGSAVVNTLLHRPQSRGLAMRFYRECLSDSSSLHRSWATAHYEKVARLRPARFWQERAAAAPPPDVSPAAAGAHVTADAPLRLSPGVEIVDLPCVVDRFIEARSAVRSPALARPVAFLGGWELTPLLHAVRRGITQRELAQAWTPRVPLGDAWAMAQWLVSRGVLVPDADAPLNPQERNQ